MARWRRWNRHWELVPASSRFPRQVATQCRSGKFSEQVESGSVRIPCLTTPSPTAEGRPPPPKRKRDESPETLSRWRKDNKQFAPWQYRAYALVEEKGKLGPPSSPGREFLHDFPEGFGYANATSGRTATSKAFIFRLEMLAQVLSVIVLAPQVRAHVPCFISQFVSRARSSEGFLQGQSFHQGARLFRKILGFS